MEMPDAERIVAIGDFFTKIGSNNLALAAAFLFLISFIGVLFFRQSHEWYRVFAFLVMVASGATILFVIFFPNALSPDRNQVISSDPSASIFDLEFRKTISVLSDSKYASCVKSVEVVRGRNNLLPVDETKSVIVDSQDAVSNENFLEAKVFVVTTCFEDFALAVAVVHCGDGKIYDTVYSREGTDAYFSNSFKEGYDITYEVSILFANLPEPENLRISVYLYDFGAPDFSENDPRSRSTLFYGNQNYRALRPVCIG